MAEYITKQQSPERVYQGKITDTIMDSAATQRAFQIQDLDSVNERIEVLTFKADLAEQRCNEAELENGVFQKIHKGLVDKALDDEKEEKKLDERKIDLDKVVHELEQASLIEYQRKYDFGIVQHEYRRNIQHDYQKMDRLVFEKESHLKQQEDESKEILFNLLDRTRDIKELRSKLDHIEEQKKDNEVKKGKVQVVFEQR